MKNILTIALLMLFSGFAFGQEEPVDSSKTDDDKPFNINLSVGKKRVKTRFIMLDVGINSYHNEGKVNIPASLETFELRHARSIEVNLHVYRQRIKIGTGIFNIEHGLSFDFNNYGFQNKVDYRIDSAASFYINSASNIQKSRLFSSKMTLPLMLHFETYPKKLSKSFHISVGGYASVRLGSNLRIKDVNTRRATTIKNDFSMNDFMVGARAEMGFGPVNLYMTYSFTDLFKTGQGPSLTPFSVGFTVIPF
jgi:hypothetical protein